MFSLSWVGSLRWWDGPGSVISAHGTFWGGVGGLPFKCEERKQTLLLTHPLGGGLGPTKAADVLGREGKTSCLGKNVFEVLQGR